MELLGTFAHHRHALYTFVAQESANPAETPSVLVGTLRAGAPVNQVFCDCLLKEKAVEEQQQETQQQR